MEAVQQSLFPFLDECLAVPLMKPEKRLVNILELFWIEKHVPVCVSRQWLGRSIKEREAIARAILRYQHAFSLRHDC